MSRGLWFFISAYNADWVAQSKNKSKNSPPTHLESIDCQLLWILLPKILSKSFFPFLLKNSKNVGYIHTKHCFLNMPCTFVPYMPLLITVVLLGMTTLLYLHLGALSMLQGQLKCFQADETSPCRVRSSFLCTCICHIILVIELYISIDLLYLIFCKLPWSDKYILNP